MTGAAESAGNAGDTDTTTVSAAEIARLAGVGRAAVSNWRRRYDDFPPPMSGTETNPSFDLTQVRGWLEQHGKLTGTRSVEAVWQLMETVRGQLDIADTVAFVGAALSVVTSAPEEADAPDVRLDDRIRAVFTRATGEEPPELPGVDTFGSALTGLAELAQEQGDPQETFERFYQRFLTSVSRQFTATPEGLAELMVDLAGRPSGTVFDPACGAGTLLRAALHRGNGTQVAGQELSAGLGRIGGVRLALCGTDPDIRLGDALRADAFPDLRAEAVVVNPPFNQRDWGVDELEFDARWEYGLPAKGDSELAWLQHALAHTRPGGSVVMLLPPGAASRRSGRRIRAELLRRGALRAAIGLPAGMAPPMGIPLTLWVLRRPVEGQPAPTDVFLMDAAEAVPEPDWARVREAVLDAYDAYTSGHTAPGDEAGHWRAVPVVDLLGGDVDPTPSRHLAAPAPDVSRLGDATAELSTLAARLPTLLPDLTPDQPGPRATVTVHDLVRRGQVELLQTASRRDTEEEDDPHAPFGFAAPDVISGGPPSRRVPEEADPVRVRPGDVLVPRAVTTPAARVVDEAEADTPTAGNVVVLRPDLEAIDPWFLSGVFSGSAIARRSTSSSRRPATLDARRVELPRLPLADQRRIGAAFRQLTEFRRVLENLSRTGEDVWRTMTDGLIDGALRLPAENPDEAPHSHRGHHDQGGSTS